MKKVFLLCFIALIFAANAAAQSGRRVVNPPPPREPVIETPSEPRPERLPPAPAELSALPESLLNRELKALDQSSFRLADFGGKVVVLNLWASWCGPCRSEIPDYEKVRKEYAGRSVEFIGLTTEDPRTLSDRVKRFVRDVNFGFRLGWADPLTARTLMNGRNAIPQTLVIAPTGTSSAIGAATHGDKAATVFVRRLSTLSRKRPRGKDDLESMILAPASP